MLMGDWKAADHEYGIYHYRGFKITHNFTIRDRQAKDHMFAELGKATKHAEKNIRFETIGDSFIEVKARICAKINSYYGS